MRFPWKSLCLLLAWLCLPAGVHAQAKKPNVLFIAVDDLNDWVGVLGGHPQTITPNIDRLAKKGMLFTRAYCAAPSCNPSRVSMLTGKRPSTSGVYDNAQPWRPALPDAVTLPAYFLRHGYLVLGGGKIFHGGFPDAKAFSEYFQGKSKVPVKEMPKNGIGGNMEWGPLNAPDDAMPDHQLTDWAIGKLKQKHEQPFFLAVGYVKPHLEWHVPQKYFDMHPLDKVQLPRVDPKDLDDVPPSGIKMARPETDHKKIVAKGVWKEGVQAYLANISFMDAQLGRLLEALEKSEHAANTIIVFWSDHGWHLGEKEHWRKFALWEAANRVPFVIAAPGTTKAGQKCGRTITLMDVYPTLIDLCGLPKKSDIEANSLVPLLKDPETKWDHPAVMTWGRNNHAVRTERWRYIRYANGDEELYDHDADPREWKNLAGDAKLAEVKKDLASHFPKVNAPDAERVKNKKESSELSGPLSPVLGGEGRGEGDSIPREKVTFSHGATRPLTPLPRSAGGEGKVLASPPVNLAALEESQDVKEPLQVLPASAEPRKMLYNHLLAEAQKHFDERRKVIANLKTPEDIKKRQEYLRAKFIDALGGFPEKTPLNAKVVRTVPADGYRVENVIYESRPQHHVTANFYIPEGKGPFPGVLLPCGHSTNGKAAEAYQRAAILMARNGLAVLCYDPIGQGERLQLLVDGKPGIPGSTSEHTMVGVGALLVGQSTASYRIWDGIRSMDYLASRPEVDSKKLGCTGNSGGGTLTAYLMALDDRIVAAAPSCYITTLEKLFATLGPQDAEQNITGQVAFGMEHADYLTLRAPRPTLICTGTYDFFDIGGSWTTFREASLIYGKLGYGERVGLFEFEDKHGFSKPRREAAMRWMRRWLLDKQDAPFETEFAHFKDEQLQCTRSGQVLEDLKGKSAFHLNKEYATELAKKREANPFVKRTDQQALLRSVLRLPEKIEPAVQSDKLLNTFNLNIEPGIRLPAFANNIGKSDLLTVYLHGDGSQLQQGGVALEKYVREVKPVLGVDLRGFGATAPDPVKGKNALFGADSKAAFLSLHLDRPLLGQRVRDTLASLAQAGHNRVHLIGVGAAGPVALHVAALEPKVVQVTLQDSLISWANVVETPISINQLTNVVPGVLKHYDLPELAASLAPRPLTIINPLDAAQRPVSLKDAQAIYRSCIEAYEQRGATKELVLQVR